MVVDCRAAVRAMAVEQNCQIAWCVDSNAEKYSRQYGPWFMCTLTVLTDFETYRTAMNRDEKITRGAGLPLGIHELDGVQAIYPGDGAGGTWFAINEYGITLALLNWNDVAAPGTAHSKFRSRGQVIAALLGAKSLPNLREQVARSSFEGMLPFRLVGVFPCEQQIWEWRWDTIRLDVQSHGWRSRHWFSSSLSDKAAERMRGDECSKAERESDRGSVPWLRRLHASHGGGPGPFSLCVHRDDVKTLSYSEGTFTPGRIVMAHFRGSPCGMTSTDTKGMKRIAPRSVMPRASQAQWDDAGQFVPWHHPMRKKR